MRSYSITNLAKFTKFTKFHKKETPRGKTPRGENRRRLRKFCALRSDEKRSIVGLCEHFWRKQGAKFTNRNDLQNKK